MSENSNKGLKSFGLSTLALKNPVTIIVLSVILAVVGITSYRSMPIEAFPEVVVPQIYVGTPYPGNSPLDIEKLIGKTIECKVDNDRRERLKMRRVEL